MVLADLFWGECAHRSGSLGALLGTTCAGTLYRVTVRDCIIWQACAYESFLENYVFVDVEGSLVLKANP